MSPLSSNATFGWYKMTPPTLHALCCAQTSLLFLHCLSRTRTFLAYPQRLGRAKTSFPFPHRLSSTKTSLSFSSTFEQHKNVSFLTSTFELNKNVPSFASMFKSGKNISSCSAKNCLSIEIVTRHATEQGLGFCDCLLIADEKRWIVFLFLKTVPRKMPHFSTVEATSTRVTLQLQSDLFAVFGAGCLCHTPCLGTHLCQKPFLSRYSPLP